MAIDCATIRFGYVASYSFFGAWMIAVVSFVAGLPLVLFHRTRRWGIGTLSASPLLLASFYGLFYILWHFDHVAFKRDQMIHFGPDVASDWVVYLKKTATETDVEAVDQAYILPLEQPNHGSLQQYMRLVPDQANGHWAFAVDFTPTATSNEKSRLKSRLLSDPRIERIYTNVAPDQIPSDQTRKTLIVHRSTKL
jgi:hypothetical protein